MKALYQYKPPRPFAPGGEVAGIVDGGARAAIGRLGARDARGKVVVMMG
jgi:hypothetical protein